MFYFTFKLYKSSTSEFIELEGLIPKWNNMNNFIIHELNEKDLIPNSYKLDNPYPNPFNPIVNIDFDVPRKSSINLFIYDLQGRLVEKLINDQLYEAGSYSLKWKAENYASGIYFVKFIGDNKEQYIKKITLLK